MHTHLPAASHASYRADIDGLRAVAVLAVVGFHAFPTLIPGGFIGVDIFFVISGFLISSILLADLEHQRYSILTFYKKRILRILPALLTVMAATLIFGWYTMLLDEYALLGKLLAGGAVFLSNILYWGESGYFEGSGDVKPMLHLWSLAVEEQFYLIWPLLLALVWKRQWHYMKLTVVVAAISFAIANWLLTQDATAAFYSPLSRFWELMIGCMLAYFMRENVLPPRRMTNVLSGAGICLLAVGLYSINRHTPSPGWTALVPTVGAFLIIGAGPHAWFNRVILSHRAMVTIGLISYPLYLWHWPLLSFAHIIDGQPGRGLRALLVAAAIVLAWLTYRFIETPVRLGKIDRNKVSMALVSGLVVMGGAGLTIYQANGLQGHGLRSPDRSVFARYYDQHRKDGGFFIEQKIAQRFYQKCNFGFTGHRTIDPVCHTRNAAAETVMMVWGDSHAQMLRPGLDQYLPATWQVLQVASSGCAPALHAQRSTTDFCATSNWFAWNTIKQARPEVVLVSQNEKLGLGGMQTIAQALKAAGVQKVVFVGPAPHWAPNLPKLVLRKWWDQTPRHTFDGVDVDILAHDRLLKSQFVPSSSQQYVSLADYLCNAQGCAVFMGSDKLAGLTTWDYGHITPMVSLAFARDRLVPALTGEPAPSIAAFR